MVIKNFPQIGNPKLREKSKKVDDLNSPELKKLVKNLLDTMVPTKLIGIAAPQIGKNVRVFATHMRRVKTRKDSKDEKPRVFINPKIIKLSKEKVEGWEGCGSVLKGELFALVPRSKKVEIEALNEHGEKFTLKAEGLLARIIQHEYDHLDGILFTDRVVNKKSMMQQKEYLKAIKEKRI